MNMKKMLGAGLCGALVMSAAAWGTTSGIQPDTNGHEMTEEEARQQLRELQAEVRRLREERLRESENQPESNEDNPGRKYVEQMRANAGGQEAMQAWMEAGKPGLPHEFMKAFEGEFEAVNRMWMNPDGPPMETNASATNTMIMDGRYLETEYEGSIMGMPFTGKGLMGFDNNKKLFTNVWIDSMSTGISTALGSFNEAGNTITFVGAMDEPMTGEMGKSYKQVFRLTEDGYVMEMWEILYGDPFKVMEIVYTKK